MKKNKPVFFDSALASNSNYMNVIKESHESILRRKKLEQEKQRILNMDFTSAKDQKDWQRLNNFLRNKQPGEGSAVQEGAGGPASLDPSEGTNERGRNADVPEHKSL